MKNRIFILILTLEIIFLTGCTTADTVNHNLTKEADEFKAYRRITVTNARTDTIMLQAEGYMSLGNNTSSELVVTIKQGKINTIRIIYTLMTGRVMWWSSLSQVM